MRHPLNIEQVNVIIYFHLLRRERTTRKQAAHNQRFPPALIRFKRQTPHFFPRSSRFLLFPDSAKSLLVAFFVRLTVITQTSFFN